MRKSGHDKRINRSMFSIRNYFIFFLLISFIVTCCFLLFLHSLDVTLVDVKSSAIITLINVMFLSLLCTIVDGLRRHFTVQLPVERILNATRKITRGDFTARIEPLHGFNSLNEFDAIIEDFNKMAAELSGTETLRTDFIASVSHELKTPLSVIQNYSTMLQNSALPEKTRVEYAKTISDTTRRLSELITNILKLNKLENQQIFPDMKEYDLGEQLRECMLGFEREWEKKNLEIETDIDDISVRADGELLTLAWNNLLSNAVKFTQPGGKITVSLKEENGYAVVKVSDTGCGMTPEVGRHIFEKFYQGEPSHTTQGNGLGLALVKRVIDIVKGEISVESIAGQGSTFIVTLWRNIDEAN
ncbi:HAMP domain-containing sensor histidine kinase [Alkaliphilus crotonatoxidans]